MRTRVVVVVSFLLLLLTWLLLSGLNLNTTRFDEQLDALDRFSSLERSLNCEVLSARAGLSRNYDALARLSDAYGGSVNRLREAAGSDAEEVVAIDVLVAGARNQQDLIEQFKSRNALTKLLSPFWFIQCPSCRFGPHGGGRGRHHAVGRHASPHA